VIRGFYGAVVVTLRTCHGAL